MAKVKKISRIPKLSNVLLWFGCGVVIIISLLNLALWARNEIAKKLKSPIEQEITYWEEIINKTPTYRDGYLKLATLYWKLNEDEKAKTALNKATEIDPNYGEVKRLKTKLGY